MVYVLIAVLIFGVFAAGRLGWTVLRWGVRWELRMVRLAIHAALFGAVAVGLALLWAGWLKI
jgi:hypothetical protein